MAILPGRDPLPEERRRSPAPWVICGLVFIVLAMLLNAVLFPNLGEQGWFPESAAMQTTRTIALAMFEYGEDHHGAYPDGTSSTEVFQKLLDGNYVSDPMVFYQPLPGKTPPVHGAKLRPENIGYDVTSGIRPHSPDDLPVVFLTGFRIDYHARASAASLVRPFRRPTSASPTCSQITARTPASSKAWRWLTKTTTPTFAIVISPDAPLNSRRTATASCPTSHLTSIRAAKTTAS